ncbi:MAG: response regulator [Deltaproteobacteria bacterium]|nr:response regulator [Deltaproteobacteria bacterium]
MSKTLLVVDDSVTMRKVFELTLLAEEVTLVTHDGGDSLLSRARDVRPSAAIVDVNLGGSVSGYDLCRALKAEPLLRGLPVLMLFSEQNPLDESKVRECGADGSIAKPFDSQTLIDRVKQLLSNSQSQMAAVESPKPTAAPALAPAVLTAAPVPAPPVTPFAPPKPAGLGSAAATPMKPRATQVFGNTPAAGITPPAAPPPPLTPPVIARPQPPVIAGPPATNTGVTLQSVAPPPVEQPVASAIGSALSGEMQAKLNSMGLTAQQAEAVTSLTRDVIERVVWEVVPQLAETMIREELRRLTSA